jgi:hypothetical protein
MTRRHVGVGAAGLFAIALLGGCGFVGDETCEPCSEPPDAVGGFPPVHRESGTSRVVSELKVGQTVHLCVFANCNCTAYVFDWRSNDPSVASLTNTSAPLSVCNDAIQTTDTAGGPQMVMELKGLRPGETQISATVSGPGVPEQKVRNVYCTTGAGAECLTVDVVGVTARE